MKKGQTDVFTQNNLKNELMKIYRQWLGLINIS